VRAAGEVVAVLVAMHRDLVPCGGDGTSHAGIATTWEPSRKNVAVHLSVRSVFQHDGCPEGVRAVVEGQRDTARRAVPA